MRNDIKQFKKAHGLDKVIVLWTANTERFAAVEEGVNDTSEALLAAIARGEDEISPSTLFAVACLLEGCTYINGSPQNTFVPGVMQLAEEKQSFIAGDDFKSGQTKMKSVLVDFLVSAGIKPVSIASYNHLGNNDGKNLSSAAQFRSKEISKSNVVDDMVRATPARARPASRLAALSRARARALSFPPPLSRRARARAEALRGVDPRPRASRAPSLSLGRSRRTGCSTARTSTPTTSS